MSDIFKVLIVVDVQNCFMYSDKDFANGATFLNLGGVDNSKEIVGEINDLNKKSNLTVFTRDYHPINHISFEKDEGREIDPVKGVWPHHCRNSDVECQARTGTTTDIKPSKPNTTSVSKLENIKLDNELQSKLPTIKLIDLETNNEVDAKDVNVYGTELSYMYFFTDLKDIIYTLNTENKNGKFKIGLEDTKIETIPESNDSKPKIIEKDKERKFELSKPLSYEGKEYITLTKGEKCNEESYSAFNYHIEYNIERPNDPAGAPMPISEKNSTGLWEFILTQANKEGKKNIEITVCGLVGNVCVIHTVLQGIAMWNDIYSIKPENEGINVKMIYSLKGNRFTDTLPPKEVKPYSTGYNDLKKTDNSFLGWMNFISPESLSGGRYLVSVVDSPPSEFSHTINGFSFIGYNGEPIADVFYELKKSVVGGRKHRYTKKRHFKNGRKSKKIYKKTHRHYKRSVRKTRRLK